MTRLIIDTDGSPLFYDQQTTIEGIEYNLEFLWSWREACWYLSFYDQDGNQIVTGIKLVECWPLLRQFSDPRLPPGRLILVDMSGLHREIESPTDLNTTHLLTYITSDDPSVALVDAIAT